VKLKSKSQRRSHYIQIARNADAIILSQVIKVLREVLVEDLARAGSETIPHPAIDAPVVEYLVRNIQRQVPLFITHRMLNLKTVAITV
jgi:hypothetical protein